MSRDNLRCFGCGRRVLRGRMLTLHEVQCGCGRIFTDRNGEMTWLDLEGESSARVTIGPEMLARADVDTSAGFREKLAFARSAATSLRDAVRQMSPREKRDQQLKFDRALRREEKS